MLDFKGQIIPPPPKLRLSPFLVFQALKADMVQYLLKLLEAGLEALDNPASTKAQIVKALKAMQRSLQYGDQVWYYERPHGRIQRGGRGSGSPLKNKKNIGFLSNSGPDPLKNYEATEPAFNVGPSSAYQRNAI